MFWIYILLFIIIVLICLLVLLLFVPINLIIRYDKHLDVKLNILFFKFNLHDSSITRTIAKKTQINKGESNNQNINFKELINKIKKIGIINFLNLVVKAIKTSCKIISEILQKIDFNDTMFNLEIGGNNACSTAISYGQASTAVTLIYEYLTSLNILKSYQITVKPNFLSEKTSCKFKLDITLKIFYIILVLIRNRKSLDDLLNFKYVGEVDGK